MNTSVTSEGSNPHQYEPTPGLQHLTEVEGIRAPRGWPTASFALHAYAGKSPTMALALIDYDLDILRASETDVNSIQTLQAVKKDIQAKQAAHLERQAARRAARARQAAAIALEKKAAKRSLDSVNIKRYNRH